METEKITTFGHSKKRIVANMALVMLACVLIVAIWFQWQHIQSNRATTFVPTLEDDVAGQDEEEKEEFQFEQFTMKEKQDMMDNTEPTVVGVLIEERKEIMNNTSASEPASAPEESDPETERKLEAMQETSQPDNNDASELSRDEKLQIMNNQ